MATIQDVARLAGVSTATVSRALAQPSRVTRTLRERVIGAVDELGYEPNVAARSLRTARSSRILVSVPDISNAFYFNVIRGAEEAARQAGYSIILGDTRNDPDVEDEYAAMLKTKEVDGLLFLGGRVPETLRRMCAKATPAPIVNACELSPDLGVPGVHIDNEAAARDVLTYLVSLGHRRIGVLSGPLEILLCQERLRGAQAVAAEARLPPLAVLSGPFSVQTGEELAPQLLAATGCTALFCFSDEIAMGAIDALRRHGLRCPEDVSVVGFDDIRFARVFGPPLTTIRQPAARIGQEAVRILCEILAGNTAPVRSVMLPYDLVVRKSTAAPR